MALSKFKKVFIISISAIVIAMVLVILFISPITKYLVEKYDEKYTGRKIRMDWAYVNPFTAYVHFHNVKVYESKSDSVFFSTQGLSVHFEMLKMLSKTYEISELTLDHPRGTIIQTKRDFNINDLITLFTPLKTDTVKAPVHFNILSFKIIEGEFQYREPEMPVNYSVTNINLESTGKRWDADTTSGTISFSQETNGGDIKADFNINLNTLDYRIAVVAHKFDFAIIEQYFKALSNFGRLTGNLDADIKATGNLNDEENINARGQLTVNDFHFGKNKDDDYASFDKLTIAIEELSPKNKKYIFDSVSLIHPVIKYEQYDHLDNIEMMFGEKGANVYAAAADNEKFNLVIEIARYSKVLAQNFFSSYYKINKVAIEKADLKYNDYSLSEKFSIAANPLTVTADSIDKNNRRANIYFKSGIQPYGNFSVALSINPNDTGDFDMQYHFQKLPVSMFNAYLISYSSFPLDRGTIELNGAWTVRNGSIESVNHLLVMDPRVTKRVKNKNTKWLPLPLIMAFVREEGNVIDYEIPITGNLKNPKLHLHDVIFDILGNIFIKPVTTPYRMEVKNVENEIEKSLTLKWTMRQATLRPEQEKFANTIADFLVKNPDASISVYPMQYAVKEKEYLLFFEAKKKYFLSIAQKNAQSFSKDDSEKVNKMSIKDSFFIQYLNKQIADTAMLFTIQDKCGKLVGSTVIENRFKQLNTCRENTFIFCFQKKGVEGRVKINSAENNIPYNGFSFYKIEYNGDLPNSLTKAYHKLQELNDEGPRKKYEGERKSI